VEYFYHDVNARYLTFDRPNHVLAALRYVALLLDEAHGIAGIELWSILPIGSAQIIHAPITNRILRGLLIRLYQDNRYLPEGNYNIRRHHTLYNYNRVSDMW
jgi:hypothetical protein